MTEASKRAGPVAAMHWDYELVGDAAAYSILQTEGYLRIAPENEYYLKEAISTYISYAFGWVEDEAEVARLRGDEERARELDRRAIALYARSRDLGKYWVSRYSDGLNDAMRQGLPAFKKWLAAEFTKKEEAEVLLWAGYGWGSHIAMAKDYDVSIVADLPFATALVERSLELDPRYNNGAGYGFLAIVKTRLAQSEADLEVAGTMWERAAKETERKSLLVLVSYAHAWAVKAQRRDVFVALLREILEAGDIDPPNRLSNRIAKRRAARYLKQVDTLFPPSNEG